MLHSHEVTVFFVNGCSAVLSLEDLYSRFPKWALFWLSHDCVRVALPLKQSKALKRRIRILERDGWQCHYCCGRLTLEDSSLDHKIPESENLIASCERCNQEKGSLPYDDYIMIWERRSGSTGSP